ncbi:MAG: type I-C CRISPR-associated endonuclease Cas1c [Armatimonadota bacterium]|nr:type I-C CRISPR-associated endonuclease Cas1c [Armatimonadota bacterium]
MRQALNTIYVLNQDAYLRRDHETLVIEVDDEKVMQVPRHHLKALVLFDRVMVTPGVMQWCAEAGITLTYLDFRGRFICRMEGPVSGNVLLRIAQHEALSSPEATCRLARAFAAGKLHNLHACLLRSARDARDDTAAQALRGTADEIARGLERLEGCEDLRRVRGIEGDATAAYFAAFDHMLRADELVFTGRTRRPPRDPVNALLSFLYALITNDCCSALEGVGLDPQVGFLHVPRPGRPSLALDLVEEFRPIFGDRLALTLFNRSQLAADDFTAQTGGAVQMTEDALRAVIEAYQEMKDREVTHPLLDRAVSWAEVPHLQARLLARAVRGDIEEYPPFLYR